MIVPHTMPSLLLKSYLNNMKIGILGTGWLGKKLINALPSGTQWVLSTTKQSKNVEFRSKAYTSYLLDFNDEVEIIEDFMACEMILISVPSSKRISVDQLKKIFNHISRFLLNYKGKLVFFSSTGIYPNAPAVVTEETYPLECLNQNLSVGEQILMTAIPQTCVFRFGGLMGDDRRFANYFASKTGITNPNAPVNHIHYQDIAGIIWQTIHDPLEPGVYNIVAPLHPTKIQVYNYQTLGKIHDKTTPSESKVVSPDKIIKALNYQFKLPNPIYF